MRKIRVAKELCEKIRFRASASGLRDPVAAIIEGQWDNDIRMRLHLAFYERDQIPIDEPLEIVDADGMELLIIQKEILAKLANGRLELDGDRIVITTSQC